MGTIQGVNVQGTVNVQSSIETSGTSSTGPMAASSLLPEPPVSLTGGSVTDLAMLMVKLDQQDESSSRQIEDASDMAAAQDDAQRVAAMRAKANEDQGAGWASGLGDIAAGACTVAGAAFSDTAGIDAHDVLSATAKAAPGAGAIVAGGFKAGADNDDANAAQFEAASQADVRRYQQAQSEAQSAADSINKVEQYLQATLQTEQQARSSAIAKA